MIDSTFHVEINGVKYRLADQEEVNYQMRAEPLRAETAPVLQGESGKFQLRPDLLEWSLNSWAGGEGLLRFTDEEATRYWISHNVDALSDPGKLKLAPNWEKTRNSTGGVFTRSLTLAKALGGLFGASLESTEIYQWTPSTGRWSAAISNPSQTNPAAAFSAVGDSGSFYYKEHNNANIWRRSSSSFTLYNNDTAITVGAARIVAYNDYLYLYRRNPSGATSGVYEILRGSSTVPQTSELILDVSASGTLTGDNYTDLLVAGNDGVFFAQRVSPEETVIWRVSPTSAAGAGYGDDLITLSGIDIDSLWFHYGILFLGGRIGPASNPSRERIILYLRGEEIGVLANLRKGETTTSRPIVSHEGHEFDRVYFAAPYGPGDHPHEWTIFAVDMISGGVFGLTVVNLESADRAGSLVAHNGSIFLSKDFGATNPGVWRTLPGTYVNTNLQQAYLDTAIHDFELADNKILSTIRLTTEPLPAGTSVEVQYQLDQSGVWESAGTFNTAGGTGTEFVVSNSTTTKIFRNLQLRIKLFNGGDTSKTPVVLQVSVRATVARTLKVWRLVLALMDEGKAQSRSFSGERQLENIVSTGDSGTIVEFKDGTISRKAGVFNTHSVIIDSYEIEVDRPGEGVASVVLREVV